MGASILKILNGPQEKYPIFSTFTTVRTLLITRFQGRSDHGDGDSGKVPGTDNAGPSPSPAQSQMDLNSLHLSNYTDPCYFYRI